jgi:hypothetical protein
MIFFQLVQKISFIFYHLLFKYFTKMEREHFANYQPILHPSILSHQDIVEGILQVQRLSSYYSQVPFDFDIFDNFNHFQHITWLNSHQFNEWTDNHFRAFISYYREYFPGIGTNRDIECLFIYLNRLDLFQSVQNNERKIEWLYMSASPLYIDEPSRVFYYLFEHIVRDITREQIYDILHIAILSNNMYIVYYMLSDERIQEILDRQEILSILFEKILTEYSFENVSIFFQFLISNGLLIYMPIAFNIIPKLIPLSATSLQKIQLSNSLIQAGVFYDSEECVDLSIGNRTLIEFFENNENQ